MILSIMSNKSSIYNDVDWSVDEVVCTGGKMEM
jgi:hypothetical protein